MHASPNKTTRKALIVAEAGVNHNGCLDRALALLDVAASAQVDIVKFQTFVADRLVTKTAAKAHYQIELSGGHESQWEMLRRLELSIEDHRLLFRRCAELGLEFMSTPFDEESAQMLATLGVRRFKIASGEVTNLSFVRHLAEYGKPLVLSTGMCDLQDVEEAVDVIRANGNPPLTLLHCVSAYPANAADCNLRAMATMAEKFDVPVGFSDHTQGLEVAFAAIALGAVMIEKHFTLDQRDVGPDHRASASPQELGELVAGIRRIESALGDGVKRSVEAEQSNQSVVRRGLVTARAIAAGERLLREDVAVRRPANGLPPSQLELIVGRRMLRNLDAGEPITAEAVSIE